MLTTKSRRNYEVCIISNKILRATLCPRDFVAIDKGSHMFMLAKINI